MADRLTRLLEITLVCSAVAMTGFAAKRTFQDAAPSPSEHRIKVDNWQQELVGDRRVGKASARYRLAVWTDYQCPACKQMESEFDKLHQLLGDSLSIVYNHYPLPMHKLAFGAAMLAECARRQGKFAQMHKALFEINLAGDTLPFDSLATVTKFPAGVLRSCASNPEIETIVQADKDRGDNFGFKGTPYLQIKDELSLGGMPVVQLEPLVRNAAK